MIQRIGVLGLIAASVLVVPEPLRGQAYHDEDPWYDEAPRYDDLSARVWFDQGQEPVLRRGDRVRVYYRASEDAFVAIFNIDTNGTVHLVYPRSPDENHYVRGGRDYRLLFPRSSYWFVDDHPGMGYYFVVASPEPFDLARFDYSYHDRGWDLMRVGRTVYSDPYVAMDDYVAALVPEWQSVPYALDFSSYHVGEQRYDYPRFLCYDCHGFRSYTTWDPYYYSCSQFRVVAYNDPYYYPAYRYRGDRVVYVRPPQARQPRFVFKERAEGEPGDVLVTARPSGGESGGDRPGVAGDGPPRRTTSGVGSGGTAQPSRLTPSSGSGRDVPGTPTGAGVPRRDGGPEGAAARPTVEGGRPTSALPGREDRGRPVIGRPEAQPRSPSAGRPVLPRGGQTQERPRPVLERWGGEDPPKGGDPPGGDPKARPTGPGAPSGPVVRPPAGGAVKPPPARPGGGTARPAGQVRPPAGSGAPGGSNPRPVAKPSGGTSTPPRPVAKPSGGSSSPPRPVARPSGGSSSPPRPVARPSGGSSSPPRPVAKPSGGSSGGARPVPPPRRPGGGDRG